MCADQVGQLLRPGGFGVGVIRRAEHGDEDLRLADFAGERIHDWHRRAAVINEQLVSGGVRLTHSWREPAFEFAVEYTEVRVAVMVGRMLSGVLFPKKLERYSFVAQFLVQLREIRQG